MESGKKFILGSLDLEDPRSAKDEVEEVVPPEEAIKKAYNEWSAWDDTTGYALDPQKVKAARRLEMDYYRRMHLFDKQFKHSDADEWFAAAPPIAPKASKTEYPTN